MPTTTPNEAKPRRLGLVYEIETRSVGRLRARQDAEAAVAAELGDRLVGTRVIRTVLLEAAPESGYPDLWRVDLAVTERSEYAESIEYDLCVVHDSMLDHHHGRCERYQLDLYSPAGATGECETVRADLCVLRDQLGQ